MPWPVHAPGIQPPLVEWTGDEPPADAGPSDAVVAFLASPGRRARLVEIDGDICASVVGASYASGDAVPLLEHVDVILAGRKVLMRRRPLTGFCRTLTTTAILSQWDRTPDGQRDASVLFVQILDAVVDGSTEVFDEIRARVGQLEERMLVANPPLNQVQSELLALSRHLSSVRDGLLPLRGDLRELTELRDPVQRKLVSPAGGRWVRNIELDLTHEVPAALAVAESRIAGALTQLQGERSESTNRVVLLLTIITVAFFLPTLLTGLYGMNVPLPGDEDRWIFWAIVGVAAAFLGVAVTAITRLGLWGTFRTVLPWTPRPETARPEQPFGRD
jgi:Mg2+ and Co2+ transporter CorA